MRVSFRLLCSLSLAASVRAAHYEVTVGKGGLLKFDPETLKAEVGDTIQYLFYAKVCTDGLLSLWDADLELTRF